MVQDIRSAVRPVLYQTDLDDYPYSCGGTMFVISFQGCCYGLTCHHVIRDDGIHSLLVTPGPIPEKGMLPARIGGVAKINNKEFDLGDIAVIWFSDDIGPEFFGGTAYIIGPGTFGPSDAANRLRIIGYLQEKTFIDYDAKSITGGYCDLEFRNVGEISSDPVIRQALATYEGHGFTSLDGISGSPVYDETEGRLCGMVVRGNLNSLGQAVIWYIDIFHIVTFVEAVHLRAAKLD